MEQALGAKTLAAYQRIRDAVVTGALNPGDPVDREQIARDLGISVQPVTTAIDRLAEDGFVDIRLQRGSFVAPIRLRRMLEANFVLAAMLLAVYERASARARAEAAEIEAEAVEVERASSTGDLTALKSACRRYRQVVLDLGDARMVHREAARACAYLSWTVDRCLHVHLPQALDSRDAHEASRLYGRLHLDIHNALMGLGPTCYHSAVKALFDNTQLRFADLARRLPGIVES